jgi:hypothetical protein
MYDDFQTGKGEKMKMDRKTYLKKLAGELRKTCTENQVKDILSDYSEFFDSGTAEGKSEERLCREFGPPEQAARELTDRNETPAKRRGMRFADITCAALTVLAAAAFAAWEKPVLQNGGPVEFLPALLFPLLIQAVFSLRMAIGVPAPAGYRHVPRVQAAFFVLMAAAAAVICYEIVHLVRIADEVTQGGSTFCRFLYVFAPWGIAASLLLASVSEVLFFLYAAHGHPKARWMFFSDTAVFTLFLNLTGALSNIDFNTYNGSAVLASSILYAVLPSFAAAILLLLLQKISASRRKTHGRSDEKGRTGNVRPV